MKRKKFREARGGHVGPNGQRVEAVMGEVKEEEEILCHIPGGTCFVKGTLVATEHGLRAIETLQKDDLVWSRDETTGKTELKPVKQVFEKHSATLKLTFSNGETIETTKEHPFYVESEGFRAAGELGIGTSIVTRAGPNVTLASTSRGEAQVVYNFEVEGFHTYFVGKCEVWVHNQCEGNFGSEDMALGLHSRVGPNGDFAGDAKTGWNIKVNPGEDLWASVTRNLDETVQNGGKIRFCVDPPFDPKQAFDAASANYGGWTCRELRYVMQKHPNSVTFYQNGQVVTRAQLGI